MFRMSEKNKADLLTVSSGISSLGSFYAAHDVLNNKREFENWQKTSSSESVPPPRSEIYYTSETDYSIATGFFMILGSVLAITAKVSNDTKKPKVRKRY
jgi:hypothetical protein